MVVKKLALLQDKQDCELGVRIEQGIIPIFSFEKGMSIHWDMPIEIVGNEILVHDKPNENTTTLNQLNSEGKIIEETRPFNEYDVYLGYPNELTRDDIVRIRIEFAEHGFDVTEEAIMHNYNAWIADLKSGYRDDENNYHLFTPCGCNPLSFRASELDNRVDWQETYEC